MESHLGVGKDVNARIDERADKSYATQVYYCMSIGATRMEEAKVVGSTMSQKHNRRIYIWLIQYNCKNFVADTPSKDNTTELHGRVRVAYVQILAAG